MPDERPPVQHVLVIVPTYNERDNVTRIVPLILDQDPRIDVLVVDDGSPDGTGQVVSEMSDADPRVHLVERASKMGLGTAYLAGFRWAIERHYDVAFEMDADFSHDPRHIQQFLGAIADADIVLGSRYQDGRVTVVNWPIGRLVMSYLANIYARAVTRLPVFDAASGREHGQHIAVHEDDAIARLTPMERRVLELVGEGLANKEIADQLGIAEKTVKNHVTSVLAKMGLQRRTQVVAWATAKKAQSFRG